MLVDLYISLSPSLGTGLSVDWIGRKLYWADSKNDKMYVSELNGTYQKTLIEEDLTNPRAVAAHPLLG
jgi:L,D-peptidoglycan transpeptidase YkuD (ErfK/YbiS/YcfS/YnhG family)